MVTLKRLLEICEDYRNKCADLNYKNPFVRVGDSTLDYYDNPIKLRYEVELHNVDLIFCVDTDVRNGDSCDDKHEIFGTYAGLINNVNLFKDYIKTPYDEVNCYVEIMDEYGVHRSPVHKVDFLIDNEVDKEQESYIIIR